MYSVQNKNSIKAGMKSTDGAEERMSPRQVQTRATRSGAEGAERDRLTLPRAKSSRLRDGGIGIFVCAIPPLLGTEWLVDCWMALINKRQCFH